MNAKVAMYEGPHISIENRRGIWPRHRAPNTVHQTGHFKADPTLVSHANPASLGSRPEITAHRIRPER